MRTAGGALPGCGLCAVGLLLTSPATSTNSFLAALLVWGVGVGMLGPAVNAPRDSAPPPPMPQQLTQLVGTVGGRGQT